MEGYLLDISHVDPFQKWAIICAAALTILYAVMRPWKKKKDPLARPVPGALAQQREVEKQMTELLIELEQMARQMTAQLDTRSAKLEHLIRQADERIAALASSASALPRPAVFSAHGTGESSDSADPPALSPPVPDPRHAAVYELADKNHTARQIAQQLGRPQGEVELILALRGHGQSVGEYP